MKPLDYTLIKRPHTAQTYTESQIKEFMACVNSDTGPEYFLSNFFYIQHPIKGRMLYRPYEYQRRLISTYHKYRFSISLMPRQSGKTTSAAGYLLWYAMFVPDSTVLIAAHKYGGAQEIMQRVRYAYESVPDHIRAGVTTYNKGSMDFDNGSRIVSQTTTETTGRGMSISLLYSDELAYVRPGMAKEFWTSVSPTLATGGKAIITSTPNSDEDQFAYIWNLANKNLDEYGNVTELGANGFRAFRAYWHEHPERDEHWATEQRAQLGEARFRREMECEFVRDEETLINPLFLLSMRPRNVITRQGQVRWYVEPRADQTYVVALDPSLGTGGDPAAIQVLSLPKCEQVAEWQHNRSPIPTQITVLRDICDRIHEHTEQENMIYYTVENNTIGEAALISIAELGEENIKGIFISESVRTGSTRRYRKGFTTTNRSKITVCAKFKNMVESGKLTIHSENVISELKNFVSSGGSFAAKTGYTDDLVLAMLLALRVSTVLQNFDAEIDLHLRDSFDNFLEPMPFIMTT